MNEQLGQIEKLTSQAVQEVFESMVSMQMSCEAPLAPGGDPGGQIIGAVGFIGEANGVICLGAGLGFVKVITSRMLGIPESEVNEEDMVNDAIGELSNMVAGYVKSHLFDGGRRCTLTIPSIVRGQGLSVASPSNVERAILGFQNGDHHMVAEILLKSPKEGNI